MFTPNKHLKVLYQSEILELEEDKNTLNLKIIRAKILQDLEQD